MAPQLYSCVQLPQAAGDFWGATQKTHSEHLPVGTMG